MPCGAMYMMVREKLFMTLNKEGADSIVYRVVNFHQFTTDNKIQVYIYI